MAYRGFSALATGKTAKSTAWTASDGGVLKTPIGLTNEGVRVNDGNQRTIFAAEPGQIHAPQILHLPSSSPLKSRMAESSSFSKSATASQLPYTQSELLFGSAGRGEVMDTTANETSRLEVVTVRQLQRALQNKITQNTRNPMGMWTAFNKLDRRGVQHLNLADIIAAVAGFNLVASDELCTQLLHALDRDHDGMLSLPEFVAGLKADHPNMQLQEPHNGVSTRRYFRQLKFHHPLHNVAHLSAHHSWNTEL